MGTTALLRITEYTRQLRDVALDLLYPPACVACGNAMPSPAVGGASGASTTLCADCLRAFLSPFNHCPRCGGRLGPFVAVGTACHSCRQKRLPFQRVVAIGDYAGALRDAVISAKELAGEPLAMALARQLAERLEAVLRDRPASLIVPIPSQPWRRLRRRTAAPETMAYELSRRLRVPIRGALYCRRLAAKQGTLGLAERAANVRDLFALRRGAAESWDRTARHQRHAILVDDVMTSGATLTEAARLLRRHGIPQITVAVIARAQGH